jgi:glycosyltransferase involved in cell wall biosynthesis
MNFETKTPSAPLFLLPKLDLSDPQSQIILDRLNDYAEVFRALGQNSNIKLLVAVTESRGGPSVNREYSGLQISVIGSNPVNFLVGIFRLFPSSEIYSRTLIAGDPVYGFLSGLLLKVVKSRNSKLQLQFHGDVYTKNSIHDFKSFVRFFIVRISLRLANSVRVVSNFQISELRSLARIGTQFIVAPIPLNYQKIPVDPQTNRSGIGIIGRLHPERGTREFISIVQELRSRRVCEPVYVIGDGKDKKFMIDELKKLELFDEIYFLGNLGTDELRDKYSKLKIILSCAPTEGYGLTLREGALSGAEVVARKSAGSVEALSEFEHNLHLYETIDEALSLIVEALNRTGYHYSNIDKIKIQKTIEYALISEWVSTW